MNCSTFVIATAASIVLIGSSAAESTSIDHVVDIEAEESIVCTCGVTEAASIGSVDGVTVAASIGRIGGDTS